MVTHHLNAQDGVRLGRGQCALEGGDAGVNRDGFYRLTERKY